MAKDKHIHIKAICHIPRMCWVMLLYKEQLPKIKAAETIGDHSSLITILKLKNFSVVSCLETFSAT